MSLLFRSGRDVETREVGTWSPLGSSAGGAASPDSALRLIPLYAATRLVSDRVACAPLHAYRPGEGTRTRVPDPALIADMTYARKFALMTSLLLWGNAYGYVVSRNGVGTPTGLVWVAPARVTVTGNAAGEASGYAIDGRPIDPRDMLHIPGYVLPGNPVGLSPLGLFRTMIETGQASAEYGRDWFRGGAVPSGVLRNEGRRIDASEADKTKRRVKASLKNGDPLVLGKDWDYTAVGIPAADARFIETAKLTATQIAAIYGVAPEEIGGETGSSLTYATLEQNQIKQAINTDRPWMLRIEDALTRAFPGTLYVRFNMDSGIRADTLTRMQAYDVALRLGVLTQDEARLLEERAPLTPEQLAAWQDNYRPALGKGSTGNVVGA